MSEIETHCQDWRCERGRCAECREVWDNESFKDVEVMLAIAQGCYLRFTYCLNKCSVKFIFRGTFTSVYFSNIFLLLIKGRCENPERPGFYGISWNMPEYHGISRNITEFRGSCRMCPCVLCIPIYIITINIGSFLGCHISHSLGLYLLHEI